MRRQRWGRMANGVRDCLKIFFTNCDMLEIGRLRRFRFSHSCKPLILNKPKSVQNERLSCVKTKFKQSLSNLGLMMNERGAYDEAEPSYERPWRYASGIGAPNTPKRPIA